MLLAASGLAAVTLLVGGTGMIAQGRAQPRGTTAMALGAGGSGAAVALSNQLTGATARDEPTTTGAPSSTRPPTTTAPPTTAAPTTTTQPAPTTTEPNPAIVGVRAPGAALSAVGTSNGDETRRIQQRLLELGFWHSGADGDYGLTTSQAVMAFQKYMGLEASGVVDEVTADALTDAKFRAHGLADAGTLVEIDQSKQLLFVVHDGRTVWVLNASTGNGEDYSERNQLHPDELVNGKADTRNGLHDIYRQWRDGWREGDLGRIYRPKYFSGGQAIHGSNHIPNYPASHGCVRVSVPAMDMIWNDVMAPDHTPVWIHGSIHDLKYKR